MLKRIIIGLVVLAFAAIVASIWVAPGKTQPKHWTLADGTRISLAGVTYGTNHTMRYGNRFVDYLYPILLASLRKKYKCRVATLPGGPRSDVVIWLWDNSAAQNTVITTPGITWRRADHFQVTTVDEHGMESAPVMGFFSSWSQGSNYLYGSAIPQFPRRSKQFRVRIYDVSGAPTIVGEFTVPNRLPTVYPDWRPSPLPMTIATNDTEVSLTAFETGQGKAYSGAATAFSRAEFNLANGSNEWRISSVSASSATGENRWMSSLNKSETPWGATLEGPTPLYSYNLHFEAELQGSCWLEEPAWNLRTELTRTTNFPPEELWIIKGVRIPLPGRVNQPHLTTNIYGMEIEFVGLQSGQSGRDDSWGAGNPGIHLSVRSPQGQNGLHLKVVEVQDDQGREVSIQSSANTLVPSVMRKGIIMTAETFKLDTREDAQSVDVTLACTKSIYLEFMAKPTAAKPDAAK